MARRPHAGLTKKERKALATKRRHAARARRDAAIIVAYLAGETRAEISARHGITPRSVSRIVARAGHTMSDERQIELNRARAARPGSKSGGRPREIILPPAEMRHYRYLRQVMSAAFARAAMGIGA